MRVVLIAPDSKAGAGVVFTHRSYAVTWRQNIEHQSGENSQRDEAP